MMIERWIELMVFGITRVVHVAQGDTRLREQCLINIAAGGRPREILGGTRLQAYIDEFDRLWLEPA